MYIWCIYMYIGVYTGVCTFVRVRLSRFEAGEPNKVESVVPLFRLKKGGVTVWLRLLVKTI